MDDRIDFGFERYAYALIGAVLERLCVPFVLLDQAGTILFANPLSEAILADGQHIARDGDRLACRSAASAKILADFLGALADTPEEIDILIHPAADGAPLYASLSPFVPPRHDLLGDIAPVAVVFIRDGHEEEAVEVARTLYGLTPAEVRTVHAVLRNQPLKAYADQQNISVHTARKQLSAAMKKAGVRSQLQLQSLVGALTRGPK